MSVFGTCCIVGRIHSRLMRESPLCCDMGTSGWCCCCISMPINFAAPFGGACYFASLTSVFLHDMERQYNLPRHKSSQCCCGEGYLNDCCELLYSAFTYPCGFFQIYMTLREMEYEQHWVKNTGETIAPLNSHGVYNQQPNSIVAPVIAKPIYE
jgi:hypothetical protein